MTRFALKGLRSQWQAWIGTFVVLALATALVYVCLAHRHAVTRPDIVARARALGVGPGQLEMSGTAVYIYSAMVAAPVVAVVGRSCVQALRTTWAQWRLAGALPRQVRGAVITTVALVALISTVPGLLIGFLAAQPVASLLTRMAAQKLGTIPIHHQGTVMLASIASVVLIAVIGATSPALSAASVPAVAALRDNLEYRRSVSRTRWVLALAGLAVCALQAWVYLVTDPIPTGSTLPAGGGQAMLLALLLGVCAVLAAPMVMPAVQRLWTKPLTHAGVLTHLAQRSAAWRGELGSSAIGLLALGLTFAAAMLSAVQTNAAAARAARATGTVNQVDTYVLAGITAILAMCGAIAVISMSSRAREREFAILRCAGSTPRQRVGQALVEPAIYVLTALIVTLVPTAIATLGEAWFLARSGLPFTPAPAWWQTALLAAGAYAILVLTAQNSARRAIRTPVSTALASE